MCQAGDLNQVEAGKGNADGDDEEDGENMSDVNEDDEGSLCQAILYALWRRGGEIVMRGNGICTNERGRWEVALFCSDSEERKHYEERPGKRELKGKMRGEGGKGKNAYSSIEPPHQNDCSPALIFHCFTFLVFYMMVWLVDDMIATAER
jgi:hypothetical protein